MINATGWELRKRLFCNDGYCFGLQELDFISTSMYGPKELDGLFLGQCALFVMNQKQSKHEIGTKGGAKQQQQIETVISA